MTYVITSGCIDVKDRSCVEACPVDCIYEGPRMLYIHPDECVDCGACEPVCPEEAIFYDIEVPAAVAEFTQINAEVFATIGSPGAGIATPLPVDAPAVAAFVRDDSNEGKQA